jgi:hypothetical protein
VTEHAISAERGEVPVTLEGVVYPMRPSGAAQMAIEDQLQTTIPELWFRLVALWKRGTGEPAEGNAGLSLKQMSVIITECIKAAGKDRGDKALQSFTSDRIAEIVATARMSYTEPLAKLIGGMMTEATGADEKKA